MAGIDKLVGSLPPEFDATGTQGRARPKDWHEGFGEVKVTIARIEYGPNAHDTKVFLSNGMQLDGLVSVAPEPISVDGMCKVEIAAVLSAEDQGGESERVKNDRADEIAKYECYAESRRLGFPPEYALIRARNFS